MASSEDELDPLERESNQAFGKCLQKILTFLLLTSVVTRDYFPLRTHYEIGLAEINGIESTITIISRLSCRFFWALLHFALSPEEEKRKNLLF